jgi:hypothetical protein
LIILKMGISQSICLGWPWTEVLLILASQLTRHTGMSHWLLTRKYFLMNVH